MLNFFQSLFSMKTRICSTCDQEKELTEYHRDTKGKDGYCARCRICKNTSRKPKPKSNKAKVLPNLHISQSLVKPFKVKIEPAGEEDVEETLRQAKKPMTEQEFVQGKVSGFTFPISKQDYSIEFFIKKLSQYSHFSLCFDRYGKIILRVHRDPFRQHKGTDLKKLLQEAASSIKE